MHYKKTIYGTFTIMESDVFLTLEYKIFIEIINYQLFNLINLKLMQIFEKIILLNSKEETIMNEQFLLDKSSILLGNLLKDSDINYLILNGSTVIKNFELISDFTYKKELQTNWELKRKNGKNVSGYSYQGRVKQVGGIELNKKIALLLFMK